MKTETKTPVAKYRLEITLPRDMAPHLAYKIAEMRQDFLYQHRDGLVVKITTDWTTATRDRDQAAEEIAGLQQQKLFPELAEFRLFGPL